MSVWCRVWGLAAVVLALVPAATLPARAADPATDLVGAWSCRTAGGRTASVTVRADGPAIVITDGTSFVSRTIVTRLEPAAPQRWRFQAAAHTSGTASDWSGTLWTLDGTTRDERGARSYRATYELVDPQTLRISRWTGDSAETGDVALCLRGDAPPDPSACVAPNLPATTLRAAMPEVPTLAAQQRITGLVRVLVSLDADSRVVSVKVSSSDSALLNASALDAARRSVFRTASRDCRPVPSEYLFSVQYATSG